MVNANKFILFVILFVLGSHQAYSQVAARADRTQLNEGETLRLIIEADDGEPDLSPLSVLFDVLGTSKSSQMNFMNGRMSSKTEWVVTLAPKHSGNLTIPAIKVGNQRTAPILVNVSKASARRNLGGGDDVFIEASATPMAPYVQAQVIYTVKLFNAVDLRDGALSEPKHDDVVIERLGNDVNYSTAVNGRTYQVTERRYALFPQKSGRIVLPSTVFGGQVLNGRGGGPGFDPFNRFFSQPSASQIRLRSDEIVLDVKATPQHSKGKIWLPARSVSLSASWSVPTSELKVGEPATLTVRIEAEGLSGAQLPNLDIELGPNFKTYPDQPLVETLTNGSSLVGVREQKLAVIPTAEGRFEMPAMSLPWWDVMADKQQVADTSIVKLVVGHASGSPVVPDVKPELPELPKSPESPSNTSVVNEAVSVETAYFGLSGKVWMWIALVAICGWSLTVLLWVLSRRGRKSNEAAVSQPNTNLSQALNELKYSCLKGDATAARNAMIKWGRAKWPEQSMVSLQDVQNQLREESLKQKIAELNGILYHNHGGKTWDGQGFWEILEPLLASGKRNSDVLNKVALPPLYH